MSFYWEHFVSDHLMQQADNRSMSPQERAFYERKRKERERQAEAEAAEQAHRERLFTASKRVNLG